METITANISKSKQIKNALINEKLAEDSIREERAITWLDNNKACFLNRTKIKVNNEWISVEDTEIEEFKNSEESMNLVKSSVPEPFLAAVLAVWENGSTKSKEEKIEVEGEMSNE